MAKAGYQAQETRSWSAGGHPAAPRHAAGHGPGHPQPGRAALGDGPRYRQDDPPQEAAVPVHLKRVKAKKDEIIFFTTQLAVMVDTGVTLPEGLDAIADQTQEPGLKAVVTDLSEQVKAGVPFSDALERYPRMFSQLFVALMRASEISGTMGPMLQRASEYMGQERETLKKVKGAMIYPACMLTFCSLVVIGLLIFVLPRFETIYANKGAALPAPTRALLALSHGMIDYWYLVLTGAAAAGVGGFLYFRSPGGKRLLDSVRIRIPLIGGMYRKAYLARSLRTMSTMISTGVSLLDGLEITAQVAGNRHYADIWDAVAAQARQGSSVSEELAKHPLVPGTVTHMVAAGERTGQLAKVMDRVADFCEQDVAVAVKSVTSLIEPAMIIIMGILIGGIAMALLLPVFSMSKLVH
jgi:type IV pilus assembly protein PilC